jgi:hypothetical protein
MFESLPSSGSYTLTAIYENLIQDPAFDPSNASACTETADPECYKLWIGAVASGEQTITVDSATTYSRVSADVSFDPEVWDAAWAMENSPTILAKISNIDGHEVNGVDVSSIKLNGTVSIVTGSNSIVNGELNVQFDRSEAVQSLGSIRQGIPAFATVQGQVEGAFFSGTQRVDIIDTFINLTVQADRHDVGSGAYPGSTKYPIVDMETKVFDKSSGSCAAVYGISWQHYPEIWGSCDAVADINTNSEGKAMFGLSPGDYLVIGHYNPETDNI